MKELEGQEIKRRSYMSENENSFLTNIQHKNNNAINKTNMKNSRFGDNTFSKLKRFPTNSFLGVQETIETETSIFKKSTLFIKQYPQLSKFKDIGHNELNKMLKNISSALMLMDYSVTIICIIILTTLYFEHFSYIRNNYTITSSGNIIRWFCLVFSLINVIIIVSQKFLNIDKDRLKFLLNTSYKLNEDINYKILIFQIIIHLLQPYPYMEYSWLFSTEGIKVTYSLNSIFFSVGLLRMYVLAKITYHWNLFTNDRAHRIFKFYDNSDNFLFLYKSNIKRRGFISLGIILGSMLYLFALIFKMYEDFDVNEGGQFSNVWNCLWYLLVTVSTIGFGDFVPVTLIGRIIGVFACILGIFILSLLVVVLMHYFILDYEEEKAYKFIQVANSQSNKNKNSILLKFLHSYIKSKFSNFRKDYKLDKFLQNRRQYTIERQFTYPLIRKYIQSNMDIKQLKTDLMEICSKPLTMNVDYLQENYMRIVSCMDELVDNSPRHISAMKTSKTISFKICNMAKVMSMVGPKFRLANISAIKGDGIIKSDILRMACKTFQVKYLRRRSIFAAKHVLEYNEFNI